MAMWQSEIGVGGGTQVYDDVASAQAASGADNDQCLVIATNSYYRYESDGAAYTVDGTTVLSTGDGGNTRWIGIAGVYVAAPNYLNAIQEEPTGFPIDPTTGEIATGDSTISFTDGTLTLSIQPVAASFDFYISGQKHISTGDTVTITDTEGLWYIYYNESGVLTATQTWDVDFIYSQVLVSIIYWDATNNTAIYVGDERHGCKMDGHTHASIHLDIGTSFRSGCALETLSTDQSGLVASHAQFGVASGVIRDEDLSHSLAQVLSTVGLPIFYRDGASGYWRSTTNAGYSLLTTGTGRMAYNQNLGGGAWQLTELTNNDFGLIHIFAVNDISNPYIAIVGQADYGNLPAARAGANDEINNLVTSGLVFAEFVPIATVIFQTSNSYTGGTNTTKSRTRTTDLGDDYVDWRYSKISPSSISVTSHTNLSDLSSDDHLQYVPVDGLRDTTAISFDTTNPYSGPTGVGDLHWDPNSATLGLELAGGSTLQIGQEFFSYVYNNSGAQIDNGKVVYMTGQFFGFPTIGLADPTSLASSFVLGVVTQDIADSAYGLVTLQGVLNDLDTSGFIAGDLLWLDGSTPGDMTNVRPTAPIMNIGIGYAMTIDGSVGSIIIRPTIVPRLIGCSDVLEATPSGGDVPAWISGNSRFEMQNFNELSALMAAESALYYAGASRLATKSWGAQFGGIDNFQLNANGVGTGAGEGALLLLMAENAGDSTHAGTAIKQQIVDAGNTQTSFGIYSVNSSGVYQFYMMKHEFATNVLTLYCGGEAAFKATKDGASELYYDAVKKLETASYGVDVLSSTSAGITVQASGTSQYNGASVYLEALNSGDSDRSKVQLTHEISDAGNTLMTFAISALNDTYVKQFDIIRYQFSNDAMSFFVGGETAITAVKDGSVELRYDGSKKLETSNTGVIITADATFSGGGATVNEFSTDGTLAGDSDTAVPTEKAVKTYAAPKLINEIVQASTDTLTAAEVSSTIVNNYGQAAENTQTLPTAAKGYNGMCVIGTAGAGAFHLKAGASDKIYLDGTALDDGDKVSLATPAVGDYFTFWTFQTGASSYDWIVTTGIGTLTDGGA